MSAGERRAIVLLVDAESSDRALGRRALAATEFSLVEAASGAEALAAFARTPPDLVVLDVSLPDTDALLLCARLRSMSEGVPVPVLVMAPAEDLESLERAYEAGAADFMPKPVNWPRLTHRLRYLLRASRAFEDARRQSEALAAKNAELDAFVYSVSHDLKAPLVTLQGMTGALLQDYADRLDEEGRYFLERIQANTAHMERLILDLLVLSRVGREARPPEDVDLAEIVDEVVTGIQPILRSRGVRVVVGPLPIVRGVRVQLAQVWRNLIGNAVKYLGNTPSPLVQVGSVDQGPIVECFVRDNGIGIDPAHHAKVFEIFQRLKEVEAEGTGVGLAIVKKIVEGAGGRVWVESAPRAGATFRFTWPRAVPPT